MQSPYKSLRLVLSLKSISSILVGRILDFGTDMLMNGDCIKKSKKLFVGQEYHGLQAMDELRMPNAW